MICLYSYQYTVKAFKLMAGWRRELVHGLCVQKTDLNLLIYVNSHRMLQLIGRLSQATEYQRCGGGGRPCILACISVVGRCS